jgi:hypothetical protein
MSPVVEAALIAAITGGVGVVGTVVVAISGHRTTNKTTVLALDAARGDRLWDKQAATYEETLSALLYRADKRRDQVTTARWTEDVADAVVLASRNAVLAASMASGPALSLVKTATRERAAH